MKKASIGRRQSQHSSGSMMIAPCHPPGTEGLLWAFVIHGIIRLPKISLYWNRMAVGQTLYEQVMSC
jgi:hypothetical protein